VIKRYGRVIFSGTRDELGADRDRVAGLVRHWAKLASEIGVGDCPTGVDALVRELLGDRVRVFAADWTAHGNAAGPIRNRAMVTWAADPTEVLAPVLVAVPSPRSRSRAKGTKICIDLAIDAGLRVVIEPIGVSPPTRAPSSAK
jgi:hypothetical protein